MLISCLLRWWWTVVENDNHYNNIPPTTRIDMIPRFLLFVCPCTNRESEYYNILNGDCEYSMWVTEHFWGFFLGNNGSLGVEHCVSWRGDLILIIILLFSPPFVTSLALLHCTVLNFCTRECNIDSMLNRVYRMIVPHHTYRTRTTHGRRVRWWRMQQQFPGPDILVSFFFGAPQFRRLLSGVWCLVLVCLWMCPLDNNAMSVL